MTNENSDDKKLIHPPSTNNDENNVDIKDSIDDKNYKIIDDWIKEKIGARKIIGHVVKN